MILVTDEKGIARPMELEHVQRALHRTSAVVCRLYMIAPSCFERRRDVKPTSDWCRREFHDLALYFDAQAVT